mgnify:CR=1 FL=1
MNKFLIFSLLAIAATPSWALSTDSDQPIEVHADKFNGDEVKQTAIYSGNVTVDDEETDKITLIGQAQLSRTENGKQKDMTSGERIVYDMRNARSEVNSGEGKRVTTIIAPRNNAQPRQGTTLSNSTKLNQ